MADAIQLGRYTAFAQLASGGMATVYLGRMSGPAGFGRTVAIKRLHPHLAREPEFVAMFLDEARLVARVQHPNVVPTLDVVTTGGELFLVLEYVRGEPLGGLIRASRTAKRPIPIAVTSAIVVGLLNGLNAAHEARDERGEPLEIVHRDVSPQNVIVGSDGVARVLDFGVAKAVSRLHTTREGKIKGKVAYMAPEQVAGHTTRRSDIYAAGLVLWEALTLRRHFDADNEAALLSAVAVPTITPPSALNPAVTPDLERVVLRALAAKPEARFATAREMAEALDASVRPASANQVAAWLESVAGPSLAERERLVGEIERGSAESDRSDAQRLLDLGSAGFLPGESGPSLPAHPDHERTHPTGRLWTAGDPASKVTTAVAAVRPRPAKTGRWWLVPVASGIVVGAVLLGLRLRDRTPSAPSGETRAATWASATDDGSATSAQARAITDLPVPSSASPDALVAYKQGMQLTRDGAYGDAQKAFDRALKLDGSLVAAHLRSSLLSFVFDLNAEPPGQREHFGAAVAGRAALGDHDRTLLDAMEPAFRRPRELSESAQRVGSALARTPDDVDLLFWRAVLLYATGSSGESLHLFEQITNEDPSFGLAWGRYGDALNMEGRVDETFRAFDRCTAACPNSTKCAWNRMLLEANEGMCERVEAGARRLLLLDGDDPRWLSWLATSLQAEGKPPEAVTLVLQQAEAHATDEDRPYLQLKDEIAVAELGGDFAGALRALRAMHGLLERETRGEPHGTYAIAAARFAFEAGHASDAARAAQEYLDRADAWSLAGWGLNTVNIRMWLVLKQAGAITPAAFADRRQAWLQETTGMESARLNKNDLWFNAYAAETPAEASEALTALADYLPITGAVYRAVDVDLIIGKIYLLAGRTDDALTYLKRASSSCAALPDPIQHTQAHYWLGQALEKKGDASGACAAYAFVLDRWGRAKPRSVTADKARDRAKAIACSP